MHAGGGGGEDTAQETTAATEEQARFRQAPQDHDAKRILMLIEASKRKD